jgi:arginyl-tRNA synthetase
MTDFEPLDRRLASWIREAFRRGFPRAESDLSGVSVVPTATADFGDYQCNGAMALAKSLKAAPRAIADSVIASLPPNPAIERAEVAGAGFINIRLRNDWLAQQLEQMESDDRGGVPNTGQSRTVVLDYSSPNVAKPMHIGHIRSTIIGNALDRLYRFLGYRVISDNHLGDWGTQFGILILGYRHFADPDAMARAPIEELERVYVKSYDKTREDDEWLARAKQELVKLQSGDPDNLALWKQFADISMAEFNRIYRRLGVAFDLVRGESYYNPRLPEVVKRLAERGLARESEGATVVFLEEERLPPCIVRKRDGGFNYATTDLATVLTRIEEFAPDKIIYVTDERQQLHFRQLFAICRRLG